MVSVNDVADDLATLINFNTISDRSNIDLIDWAQDKFEPLGAECVRIPSDDGKKQNLWARFGGDEPGGIVLSGHTDVVPVEGQDWHTDPFVMQEKEGRLYGRGTCDMKCFLAYCTAYASTIAKMKLKRPVHIAFSYDEEVGCTGVPSMIEKIAKSDMKPSVAWIGEPTNWRVVSGHKGITVTKVEITGREAHSSQTHMGISAIQQAAKLLTVLNDIAEDLSKLTSSDGLFEPGHPTLTVGQIQGGTASNILAHKCTFVFDLRCSGDVKASEILKPFYDAADALHTEMSQRYPETGVSVTQFCDVPPLNIDLESEAEQFVRRLTGDNAERAVAYAAEAGQFNEAGMPAVICGPGSIDQAHRPNEFIEKSEISKGIKVFDSLMAELRA